MHGERAAPPPEWATVLLLSEKWGTPPWKLVDDDPTTKLEWHNRMVALENARVEADKRRTKPR